jgi:hypothetical protein
MLAGLTRSCDQSGVTATGVRLNTKLFDSHVQATSSPPVLPQRKIESKTHPGPAAAVPAPRASQFATKTPPYTSNAFLSFQQLPSTRAPAIAYPATPASVPVVECKIIPPTSAHPASSRTPETVFRQPDSVVTRRLSWKEFQLRAIFPNTKAGSPHMYLNMACFNCGTHLIQGADINRIYRGAIWTSCLTATLRQGQDKIYNPFKKCDIYNAECHRCGVCVGSIYLAPYEGCGSQPFPCAKLTYQRETPHGPPVNAMGLTASYEEEVTHMLANLTRSSDQSGVTVNGVRLNTRLYDQYT